MYIREYSEGDYSSILDIYSKSKLDELKYETDKFELLPLDKDEARYSQILESDVYVYGATDVIAFCAFNGSEIRALFVHPDARGKGVGAQLLEFMLSKINGVAILYVAASNLPAIKLYQKFGFKISSEFMTTYNDVNVLANKMEHL
ncbi:GNAT family N-acetyltransferase [Marinomonas colpomeniae]|uniref:GNAT family N-acetyltransferase n=1 Tax=Marinomonas colpomeniae TaxID=2774408 RepID=A0ABR8NZP5_9GAMM|nr:GNAT family N-acetyltransferase [Marinomonas colpomeniae]MBD5771388.1 GNAT family N-acetyltransferase [Marinomonas colpomeniae]